MSVNKEVIERIRNSFLAIIQEKAVQFDHADVENIKQNDWWIERYVQAYNKEDVALKNLVKTIEWRKTFGVRELTEDYFPEDIYKIGFNHTQFKDKEGRAILWIRLKRTYKSDLNPLVKKFLTFRIETLDRQTSHQGWALIFDCTGAGLSNVDMDMCNFMTETLENIYPASFQYMAFVELPWILNATAKLVMSFFSGGVRKRIKFLKCDELSKYMDTEYIPVHLKGSHDKDVFLIPEGVKPLEELTHTKFSAKQIQNFRSIYEKELKQLSSE